MFRLKRLTLNLWDRKRDCHQDGILCRLLFDLTVLQKNSGIIVCTKCIRMLLNLRWNSSVVKCLYVCIVCFKVIEYAPGFVKLVCFVQKHTIVQQSE